MRTGLSLSTNPIALSPSTISPRIRRLPRESPVALIQYITICSLSIRAPLRSNSSFNTWSQLTFFGNIDSNSDIKACSRFSRNSGRLVMIVCCRIARSARSLGASNPSTCSCKSASCCRASRSWAFNSVAAPWQLLKAFARPWGLRLSDLLAFGLKLKPLFRHPTPRRFKRILHFRLRRCLKASCLAIRRTIR